MALMTSKESHKMACFLSSRAKPGSLLVVLAYTFDLLELAEALIDASRRGAGVQVIADYRTTLGGNTRDQVQRLRALRSAGIAVLLASGIEIQPEYAAVNRSVRTGQGIQHSKVLRMDEYLIVGSANWTTSSKCNVETCALVQLEAEGRKEFDRRVELILRRSTPLTPEVEDAAERKRFESKSRNCRSVSPVRRQHSAVQRAPSSPATGRTP